MQSDQASSLQLSGAEFEKHAMSLRNMRTKLGTLEMPSDLSWMANIGHAIQQTAAQLMQTAEYQKSDDPMSTLLDKKPDVDQIDLAARLFTLCNLMSIPAHRMMETRLSFCHYQDVTGDGKEGFRILAGISLLDFINRASADCLQLATRCVEAQQMVEEQFEQMQRQFENGKKVDQLANDQQATGTAIAKRHKQKGKMKLANSSADGTEPAITLIDAQRDLSDELRQYFGRYDGMPISVMNGCISLAQEHNAEEHFHQRCQHWTDEITRIAASYSSMKGSESEGAQPIPLRRVMTVIEDTNTIDEDELAGAGAGSKERQRIAAAM